MVSARRMLTRCLIRLCHDKFVGTHGKIKFDSAGVRTGVYLHRIQVLWEQKIELSLGARGADCSSCILCFSVMHITFAEMLSCFKFPIRCNLRISGIWDLSVRHVRKCYGTPRPQSAPSPFNTPLVGCDYSHYHQEKKFAKVHTILMVLKYNMLNMLLGCDYAVKEVKYGDKTDCIMW